MLRQQGPPPEGPDGVPVRQLLVALQAVDGHRTLRCVSEEVQHRDVFRHGGQVGQQADIIGALGCRGGQHHRKDLHGKSGTGPFPAGAQGFVVIAAGHVPDGRELLRTDAPHRGDHVHQSLRRGKHCAVVAAPQDAVGSGAHSVIRSCGGRVDLLVENVQLALAAPAFKDLREPSGAGSGEGACGVGVGIGGLRDGGPGRHRDRVHSLKHVHYLHKKAADPPGSAALSAFQLLGMDQPSAA